MDAASTISPFPPPAVTARTLDKSTVVNWEVPSGPVLHYEIFRSLDGGAYERIGQSAAPPFVDCPPEGKSARYSVSVVNRFGTPSRPREAAVMD